MKRNLGNNLNNRKGHHHHHHHTSAEPAPSLIDWSYIKDIQLPPPNVSKVDHHSITLSWDNLNDEDEVHGDQRLMYELQEETSTHEYKTLYQGYADSFIVEDLPPLRTYKYRLVVSYNDQHLATSDAVTASTANEPYDASKLHKAVLKKEEDVLVKIIESGDVSIDALDKFGQTPLMVATRKGFLSMISILLDYGADVEMQDSSGKNSLMLACFIGSKEIARKLRDAGLQWSTTDKNGCTSLHYAVDSCNKRLIEWMIAEGAPLEAKDTVSGWTPLLRVAATSGDHDTCEVLLDAGADVNLQDFGGKSSLMMACLNGHLLTTQLLLERGADIDLKTAHGKTCFDMALSFDRGAVISLLESFRAKK